MVNLSFVSTSEPWTNTTTDNISMPQAVNVTNVTKSENNTHPELDLHEGNSVVDWIFKISYYSWYVFIILGVITNILSFVVFLKRVRNNKGFVNIYLAALAFFDGWFILGFMLLYILSFYPTPIFIHWLTGCNLFPLLVFLPGELSDLMITTITIDRYIAIMYPFEYKRLQSKKKIVGTLISYFIACMALNWYSFGGMKGIPEEELMTIIFDFHCRGRTDIIDAYYFMCFPWIEVICFFVVPSVIICIFNTRIIMTIWKRIPHEGKPTLERKHNIKDTNEDQAPENPDVDSNKIQSEVSVTMKEHGPRLIRLCIVVSFSFILLMAPRLIFRVVLVVGTMTGKLLVPEDTAVILLTLFTMLAAMNHSGNFWLYCFSAASFRKDLKSLLCCKSIPD